MTARRDRGGPGGRGHWFGGRVFHQEVRGRSEDRFGRASSGEDRPGRQRGMLKPSRRKPRWRSRTSSTKLRLETEAELKERRAGVPADSRSACCSGRSRWTKQRGPRAARAVGLRPGSPLPQGPGRGRGRPERSSRSRLEQIAGLTQDEAREIILKQTEDEVRHDMAKMVRNVEEEARHEADRRARDILSTCHPAHRRQPRGRHHRFGGPAAFRRHEGPHHRPRRPEHPDAREPHRHRLHHRRHPGSGRALGLRHRAAGDRPADPDQAGGRRPYPSGQDRGGLLQGRGGGRQGDPGGRRAGHLRHRHPRTGSRVAASCSAGSSSARAMGRTCCMHAIEVAHLAGADGHRAGRRTPSWPNGPACCTTWAKRSTTRWRARTRSSAPIWPGAMASPTRWCTSSRRTTTMSSSRRWSRSWWRPPTR